MILFFGINTYINSSVLKLNMNTTFNNRMIEENDRIITYILILYKKKSICVKFKRNIA